LPLNKRPVRMAEAATTRNLPAFNKQLVCMAVAATVRHLPLNTYSTGAWR
jgi:hypothetical protein